MKKMLIDKQLYTVLSMDEFRERKQVNPEAFKEISNEFAVEYNGYVYPIIPREASMVGVKDDIKSPVIRFNKPTTEDDKEVYNSKNIIDFDNASTLQDMIRKQAELEAAERTILIGKDNIYTINIDEQDTPEFALLKDAINRKKIDMTVYSKRFGSDASNNLRLLNNSHSITFMKLKAFAEALDLELNLTITDKPGCPNPVGETLSAKIL